MRHFDKIVSFILFDYNTLYIYVLNFQLLCFFARNALSKPKRVPPSEEICNSLVLLASALTSKPVCLSTVT